MKIRIIAIMLLLCSILSACSVTNTSTGDSEDDYTAGPLLPAGIASLERYELVLSKLEDQLPQDFVFWEHFSHLGDFASLRFVENYDYYAYRIYDHYTIRYDSFSIYIDHSPEPPAEDTVYGTVTSGLTTMLRHSGIYDENYDVIVPRGNYEYYYKEGDLRGISWYSDGKKFTIVSDFSKYLKRGFEESPIRKLLSVNEAEANAAFAEITSKLATK